LTDIFIEDNLLELSEYQGYNTNSRKAISAQFLQGCKPRLFFCKAYHFPDRNNTVGQLCCAFYVAKKETLRHSMTTFSVFEQ